jgi:undecaprenyl-diphosphatase
LPPSQPHDDSVTASSSQPGGELVRAWLIATSMTFSALLLGWILLGLASASGLARIDLAFVLALHDSADARDPIGSRVLEGIARDVTSLGSNTILVLLTLAATVLLSLLRRGGAAALLFSTASSALVLNSIIKLLVDRPRPGFTSVTLVADTSSFPSSHAMLSSVVLLLLAAIAARECSHRGVIAVLMTCAVGLTVLIGFTRVYLGAHWPSDVLAGWVIGSAWVLLALKLSATPQPPA